MFVYSVSTVKMIVTNFLFFIFHDLISSVIVQKLVSMWDKKIQCRPFCCPEKQLDFSKSGFPLQPAPYCYMLVRGHYECAEKKNSTEK